MNEQQITDFMAQTKGEIAALRESNKSAHKRIDETGELTASVNQLAREVSRAVEKIENINKSIERLERSLNEQKQYQKLQAEKIADFEKKILTIEINEKAIEAHSQKIEDITKEPATKWKNLVSQVTSLVVAALIGVVIAKLM